MSEIIQASTGFSYDDLDADVATEARVVVARFRGRFVNSAIETGRDLIAIKQKLGHGRFGQWVRAELGITERTAQHWMRVAEAFGDKPETVSHLPSAVLYRLASKSVPASIRAQVIAADQPLNAATLDAMIGQPMAVNPVRTSARTTARDQSAAEVEDEPLRTGDDVGSSTDKNDAASKAAEGRVEEASMQKPNDQREASVEPTVTTSSEIQVDKVPSPKPNDRQGARADQTTAASAASKAAELIAARFGDDLPELLSLMERSGTKLIQALRVMVSQRSARSAA
jgi:hypothetical protein